MIDTALKSKLVYNSKKNIVGSAEPLTFDEVAVVMATVENRVKPQTKMAICKQEQKMLEKLRKGLIRFGVNCKSDISNNSKYIAGFMNF